jgi:predicted adenine nucleotide alpha hydrolase (AANH) superfamily ATPase
MLRFLLHTCCAPCSIAVIDELRDQFDLTVFFYNPNIFPEEEYSKRKNEVVKVCNEWSIKMIDWDYEIEKWEKVVTGKEDEPEGGARCPLCFALRINTAAQYAHDNGFEFFSTTLTSGRNKSAAIIFPIAEQAAAKFGVKFYAEDWKKGGRQEKGKKMVAERGIYRQNYCGCRYSLNKKSSD